MNNLPYVLESNNADDTYMCVPSELKVVAEDIEWTIMKHREFLNIISSRFGCNSGMMYMRPCLYCNGYDCLKTGIFICSNQIILTITCTHEDKILTILEPATSYSDVIHHWNIRNVGVVSFHN